VAAAGTTADGCCPEGAGVLPTSFGGRPGFPGGCGGVVWSRSSAMGCPKVNRLGEGASGGVGAGTSCQRRRNSMSFAYSLPVRLARTRMWAATSGNGRTAAPTAAAGCDTRRSTWRKSARRSVNPHRNSRPTLLGPARACAAGPDPESVGCNRVACCSSRAASGPGPGPPPHSASLLADRSASSLVLVGSVDRLPIR
jgi:hypothetical protein